MKNILLVANYKSDIGYAWWLMENYWCVIAARFNKENLKSYLIYPEITKVPETISQSTIEIEELDINDRSIGNLFKLKRFIQNNKIAYIYLTDKSAYSVFYILLRLFGIKKIIAHDHTPGHRDIPTGLLKLAKSIVMRLPLICCDQYIGVTEYIYKRHINTLCIPKSKCAYASNGITPLIIDASNRPHYRKEFNIPEDAVMIVSTGRATFYKGIDFIIKCANSIINDKKHDNAYFIFCGAGPDMQAFKTLVSQFQLENYFIFAGMRNDTKQILQACDVAIHASHGEVGYSLSILEYMSAGLATMVPDLESTKQAIDHEVDGIHYKFNDIVSAVTYLEKLIIDRKYRQSFEKKAIQKVNDVYNISNTNIELIRIFERLLF